MLRSLVSAATVLLTITITQLAFADSTTAPAAVDKAAADKTTADNATADKATASPSGRQSMSAVITEVHGLVQYRENDSDSWHPGTANMQISEGGELRTGPHSSVTCVIPPDQQFTLDRLGTVRVEEAARHGNKISTDLVMKYGRTRYQIEAAGLEHEAKISSPSSTLAVRGTTVSLYDQPPYKPEAISYTRPRGLHLQPQCRSGWQKTWLGHAHRGRCGRCVADGCG